jgi:hypothetical protein
MMDLTIQMVSKARLGRQLKSPSVRAVIGGSRDCFAAHSAALAKRAGCGLTAERGVSVSEISSAKQSERCYASPHQREPVASELREAFGVRGACSRFRIPLPQPKSAGDAPSIYRDPGLVGYVIVEGSFQGTANILWTAPSAGTIDISGAVLTLGDSSCDERFWALSHNGNSLLLQQNRVASRHDFEIAHRGHEPACEVAQASRRAFVLAARRCRNSQPRRAAL